MSDIVDHLATLRNVLVNGFTQLPLYWPNDDRAPTLENAPSGFVYSENHSQDEQQITFGGPTARRRDFGEFQVLVYVPRGTKIGTAELYAQQIRALYTTNPANGLVVKRKIIDDGGTVDGPNGRWYAVSLRIEWFGDRLE